MQVHSEKARDHPQRYGQGTEKMVRTFIASLVRLANAEREISSDPVAGRAELPPVPGRAPVVVNVAEEGNVFKRQTFTGQ